MRFQVSLAVFGLACLTSAAMIPGPAADKTKRDPPAVIEGVERRFQPGMITPAPVAKTKRAEEQRVEEPRPPRVTWKH